jgi:hypothetical protein
MHSEMVFFVFEIFLCFESYIPTYEFRNVTFEISLYLHFGLYNPKYIRPNMRGICFGIYGGSDSN